MTGKRKYEKPAIYTGPAWVVDVAYGWGWGASTMFDDGPVAYTWGDGWEKGGTV